MSHTRTRTIIHSVPKNSIGIQCYPANGGAPTAIWGNPVQQNGYDICTDATHKGPPYKSGGPLDIDHSYVEYHPTDKGWFYSRADNLVGGFKSFKGQFIPPTPSTFAYTKPDLTGWGAKGWARALPIRPVFNTDVFLYELKDIPDMLKSTYEGFKFLAGEFGKGRSLKFWGDQTLNVEFGMLPLYDDLKTILSLGERLDSMRGRILKGNRQRIHRKVPLLSRQDRTSTLSSGLNNELVMSPVNLTSQGVAYDPGKQGSILTITETRRNIWFEGVFRFHIPDSEINGPRWWILNAQLLGLFPDFYQIWKVTPWSWMFDWFYSWGDILHNLELMDEFGQVAEYAYVMCHDYIRVTNIAQHRIAYGHYSKTSDPRKYTTQEATASRVRETLQRQAASPYGFGLTWDSFNPFQLSVLAALGLSRSKFEL
jgi:hypothetical protein